MLVQPLRFEVLLNRRRVALIGTESFGVVSAIISWVQRSPNALTDEVRGQPDFDESKFLRETCTLDLGGLDSTTHHHFGWDPINLEPGDEVTVRVVRGGECDSPPPPSNTSLERTREG
jgi:hypothetical protein